MVTGVPYTSEMSIDIIRPARPGSWPVVVGFHGSDVGPGTLYELGNVLADAGAVVFLPDWHSSQPTAADVKAGETAKGWEDAACAIRFARANAAAYGGNPARLIAIGHSVGGSVAASMVLAGDQFSGDCLTTSGSAVPDGIVTLDSPMDLLAWTAADLLALDPTGFARTSPAAMIDKVRVPRTVVWRMFASTQMYDPKNPDNPPFVEKLRAHGATASFALLDLSHMAMSAPQPETVSAIEALLAGRRLP